MEEEIAEIVHEHGWYAASIFDHEPPFLYSIGLMQTYEHPEFIVFGLDSADAHALVSGLIQSIRDGQTFAQPGIHDSMIGGAHHGVEIRSVHRTQHPLYLGFAMGYCRHIGRSGGLQAVQVFWPDAHGRFPSESGCDAEVFQRQPRLDIALTPSEIRRFEHRWQ